MIENIKSYDNSPDNNDILKDSTDKNSNVEVIIEGGKIMIKEEILDENAVYCNNEMITIENSEEEIEKQKEIKIQKDLNKQNKIKHDNISRISIKQKKIKFKPKINRRVNMGRG
jgi:hypothetical protein